MKAVVLLSGGLDSAVVLAIAKKRAIDCYAISFDYNQRHRIELSAAAVIAQHYEVPHHIITITPSAFGCSSLVNNEKVPKGRTLQEMSEGCIPNTYVPARNTLFLAFALGQAEMINAHEIHMGVNALDHNGYPDCRPAFVNAFQALINIATKQSIEMQPPQLITPLLHLNKEEIILKGMELGVPIHLTHSCYDPKGGVEPCGECDACILRNGTLLKTGMK